MLGFVDFDAAKAWKQSRLALAKFRAQCDENGEPWDQTSFPDLPEVLFWIRQALGVIFGIVCGIAPLTGWAGIVVWVVFVALPLVAYQQVYLDIDWAAPDAEKDDGISYQWFKLFQEGLMPSFGMFTLAWVVAFTAAHPGLDLGEAAALAAAATATA